MPTYEKLELPSVLAVRLDRVKSVIDGSNNMRRCEWEDTHVVVVVHLHTARAP